MTPRPWADYPALTSFRPDREQPGLRNLLDRTLCLPFHPGLTREDVRRTAGALLGVLARVQTT
jgi:dTDP-4-amino-4,6-dideoxygalactose transaminase